MNAPITPTTQQNTPTGPAASDEARMSSLLKKASKPGKPAMARQPMPMPK